MAIDINAVSAKASAYAAQVRNVMPVSKVYIFGSYSKGIATELSDVDICFFLDSFDGKRRVDIIKELLNLTSGYDDLGFEPVALPSSELYNGNPFAMEVVSTGIEV
jgi:predicted nucleotidyltransferase